MKSFLSLAFAMALCGVASAAPYVVYTGTAKAGVIATQGTGTFAGTVHLITDLADSSNYAMVQIDGTKKFYLLLGRPASNPPADATIHNFISGIVNSNGKTGVGVLNFTSIQPDGYVSQIYATGPLTLKSTALVAARPAPLKVWITTSGSPYASFTFPPSAAITSGNLTLPNSFVGKVTGSGEPYGNSMNGAISMVFDKALTALANIGGSYVVGKNIYAVMPVTQPSGSTETQSFVAWLADLAELGGAKESGEGANASVIFPIACSEDPGNMVFSGTLSGIPSVTLPTGTLSLVPKSGVTPSSYTTPVINAAQYGTGFSGILSVGSTGTSFYSGSTNSAVLTRADVSNPGATLNGFFNTENVSVSGLVLGTTPGTTTGTFGSGNLLASQNLWLTSATLNITSNNAGVINGNFTLPVGVSSIASSFTFTNASVFSLSTNQASPNVSLGLTLQPGDTVTGTFAITGGTLNDNSTALTADSIFIYF